MPAIQMKSLWRVWLHQINCPCNGFKLVSLIWKSTRLVCRIGTDNNQIQQTKLHHYKDWFYNQYSLGEQISPHTPALRECILLLLVYWQQCWKHMELCRVKQEKGSLEEMAAFHRNPAPHRQPREMELRTLPLGQTYLLPLASGNTTFYLWLWKLAEKTEKCV